MSHTKDSRFKDVISENLYQGMFMSHTEDTKFRGIATLFDHAELKRFVKFYLLLIFILELFILLICFLLQLEPINMPFPWKYYFLASFLIPIGLTFLLGVFVTAFNLFLFGQPERSAGDTGSEDGVEGASGLSGRHYIDKVNLSLSYIRQAPFLLSLLLLIIGVILFSQIDVFLTLLGSIGEKALYYLFILLAVLLFIGTIFIFVWVIIRYKLDKLRYQYEYKRDIMAQLGMIVTEDNRIIDGQGRVVAIADMRNASKKKEEPLLITGVTEETVEGKGQS